MRVVGTDPAARRRFRRVALTGTPGTGKSTVARRLRDVAVVEVGEAALRHAAGRRLPRGRGVEVDLARLRRALSRRPEPTPTVLVGHLAHLLPVDGAIVLRCHPLELARRLARARRGSASDRRENVGAEALDLVLTEARARRLPVWEVDTTARSPSAVARDVARLLDRRPRPRPARVDWLADRRVTDFLLRGPR